DSARQLGISEETHPELLAIDRKTRNNAVPRMEARHCCCGKRLELGLGWCSRARDGTCRGLFRSAMRGGRTPAAMAARGFRKDEGAHEGTHDVGRADSNDCQG